jgi:FixJ family two-component response regulator
MFEKKRIYIVDDDVSIRRALKILLTAYGYKVMNFGSAEEFLRTVPNHVPGCLVLDIHMPGMDGWETQRRLFESGSKRPIIIISADKDGGLKSRALNAGAIGFLLKPFPAQQLVDLLRLEFGPKDK